MSEFATVIAYSFDNIKLETIILDTIEEPTVSGSATITSQPMVNGDMISDHIYHQPKTFNINGVLSLNGSKVTVVDGEGCKLANFQDLFEKIQQLGILCEIYKISTTNDKDIRFLHRGNMALESFTWTEGINTLSYNLSFKEILTTEVKIYNVDIDDELLPNITEPNTLSFTTSLIDWDKIDTSLVDILEKERLWTQQFKNVISSMTQGTLQSTLTTTIGIATLAIAASIIKMVAASASIGGLIGGIIVLGVAAIYIFFKGLSNSIKEAKRRRKYAIEVFDAYKNNHKTDEEIKRFGKFVSDIHSSFESINDVIHVYQISENIPQESMISVGDDYFIFTFEKNNTTGKYNLHIENVNQDLIAECPDITTAKKDFSQLTSNNELIQAHNNSMIYLLCPSDEVNDLTNYFIVVCDFDVDNFQNMITDIINKAIFK